MPRPLFQRLSQLPFSRTIPLALLGVLFSFYYLNSQSIGVAEQAPVRPPSTSPYAKAIAGAGIIEPMNEAVEVAPHFNGRVAEVLVTVGDFVEPGQPLLRLDAALLQAQAQRLSAEVQAAQARLAAAQARYQRLQQEPRNVTLPPLQASVKRLEKSVARAQDTLKRYQNLSDARAISEQERVQQQLVVEELQAQLEEAKASLAAKQAGAWQPELAEAQALVQDARAQLKSLEAQRQEIAVQLRQATLVAPQVGKVLQVNVRPGETVQLMQMGGNSAPPILLGNTDTLQVRVDIDEVLASQVQAGMEATAIIKGNRNLRFPLRFQYMEPFMVPKRSLTGSTAERNDVRVLQLVYSFEVPQGFNVYPGQQVEVYLKQAPSPTRPKTEQEALS